jgi:hypothetical protein
MTIIFAMLFALSAAGNVILVWYIRKLIKNLNAGVRGIDDLQQLLQEYTSLLEGMLQLNEYYGDDTVAGAVKNTKLVIEACKYYKKSVLETDEEAEVEPDQTR